MDLNTEVRDLVRSFVDREIRPEARELDARPDGAFPWGMLERANQAGLASLTLSEASGGADFGLAAAAGAVEELARGDCGVALTLASSLTVAHLVERFGSEPQRASLLASLRSDQRSCLALSAEGAEGRLGQVDGAAGRPPARARAVDGGWVVDGWRRFVGAGGQASHLMVFVPATDDRGGALTLGLLLDRGHGGLEVTAPQETVGRRLGAEADLHFEGCRVRDAECLPGDAEPVRRVASRWANLLVAAAALGVGRAAYEQALTWTRQRVQGGKPIIEHDTVQVALGRIKMHLDCARSYVHLACQAPDADLEDPTLSYLPKVLATDLVWKIAVDALELHGGWGYMHEVPMEKLVRDAASLVAWGAANRQLLREAGSVIRSSERVLVAAGA